MIGERRILDGVVWAVGRVKDDGRWVWIVNVKHPMDQARLGMARWRELELAP